MMITCMHISISSIYLTGLCDYWQGDSFKDLFEDIAELAHVLTDNLIMSYDSKRIFSSVTPNTLNLPEKAVLGTASYHFLAVIMIVS